LILILEEHRGGDIPFADFQTCICFDNICDRRCGIRVDGELGAGVGGTVSKVYNVKENRTWAQKVKKQAIT